MGIILRGPGIYVPPDLLTNKDIVELKDMDGKLVLDTSDERIIQLSGIHERRVSLDKNVKELGVLSVQNLVDVLGEELAPDEIRFATNRHRDGEFPCYAAAIADYLGVKAIIQDGLAGCTGLVYGIRDAYNAILSGEINSSIVGGIERLTDFTNYADRTTCFLFGDGGGWYKLERRDGVEGIIANVLGGMPDKGNNDWPSGHLSIVRSMGKKLKKTFDGYVAVDAVDDYLIMNGREVFRFATTIMRKAVHDVLHKSGKYELSDVDVIIPHGANIRIIDAANEELVNKGFKGTVYTNLDRFGNTSTASIPIAAAEAIEKGIIKENSLVINVAFGAGFTYGANLYKATLE